MNFAAKTFEELSAGEIYEILKARAEIFIVEQKNCYQDMDGLDYRSLHCFLTEGDRVVAYLRAFYEDESRTAVHIGRVLTLTHGKGTGRQLLERSLPAIRERMQSGRFYVGAQKHAVGFYQKFGFRVISDDYLEEGIVHVNMEAEFSLV